MVMDDIPGQKYPLVHDTLEKALLIPLPSSFSAHPGLCRHPLPPPSPLQHPPDTGGNAGDDDDPHLQMHVSVVQDESLLVSQVRVHGRSRARTRRNAS